MALTFTGTGGLFTKLGQLFKFLRLINEHQSNTVAAMPANIAAQYQSTLQSVPAPILNNVKSYLQGAEGPASDLATAAQQTILQAVQADTPAAGGSLAAAIANVVYQMQQQAYYVNPVTVGTSTALYPSGGSNTGDGQIVLTTKRGDGLIQQHIIAEVDPVICTSDSQTGGAIAGQEAFTFVGAADAGDPYSYQWPTGSSGSATLNAIAASVSASSGATTGNLLVNGGFDAFTGGAPNNWTVDAGVSGTDYQAGGSGAAYQGANCLELLGGGSVLQSISQQFANGSSGTGAILQPNRTYVLSFWAKFVTSPAAGVIKFELVGGSTYGGATITNDSQSVANSTAFTVSSGFTNTWAPYSVVFRTPRVLPAVLAIRIVTTTLISAGTNVFIDNMALAPVSQLYPGGPGAAIFSGVTPFINGDGWYATMTNNRDSATFMGTFSAMFDRFFGMRALGLILPYTGTTNIPDTLITS